MFKNDAFYTFPIAAVKYVPTGQGKKMKILRSDRHAKPGMGMEMFAATFPSTPPITIRMDIGMSVLRLFMVMQMKSISQILTFSR